MEFGLYTLNQYRKSGLIKDFSKESLSILKTPDHYVICPYCHKKFLEVTNRHYKIYHPDETDKPSLHSKLNWSIKTQAIRELNNKTRSERIGKLIQYNKTEKGRDRVRKQSLERWKDPIFRQKMDQYQRDHKEAIDKSAAHARIFNHKKASSLHKMFKEAMELNGITGFETEVIVGPYSIDEANMNSKIAIEVDGCFYHGCKVCGFPGCSSTLLTDRRKTTYLSRKGWKIIRFPEHDIRKNLLSCIDRLKQLI